MVLDGNSSQEYPVNAGVPESCILGPTFFLLYINDLPGNVICDIAIYADDTTLYSKCDQHLICGNNLNWLLNLNLIYETLWTEVRSGLLISMLSWFHLTSLITMVLLMWKWMGLLRKNQKMLGLTFSSRLDWGSYMISIGKTACKNIGALIHSMKFFSPEVAVYLYKFTICPCMEYCCQIWAGGPSCYLESLEKL